MALLSDWYYGKHATGYEAKRRKSRIWAAENRAVESFVERGPVLDVPIGTGRYIPIYQSKGLDFVGVDISPDMIAEAKKRADFEAHIGSVTDLPFNRRQFATAVCTRLMNWLPLPDMQKAVRELHRVAGEVIVGIRFGPGPKRMFDHDRSDFLDALGGAWLTDSAQVGDNEYHIFRSRLPTWDDVNAQFKWQPKSAQRIADNWCERIGVDGVDLKSLPVRCEYMSGKEIWSCVSGAAKLSPIMKEINGPPRVSGGPLTMLAIGGHRILLDGRHRAKQWKDSKARYPVFVIEEH